VRVEPDARQRIRKALADAGRRIAVLDDDPTGSQTVHDVAVVTVFDPDEIAAGLDGPARPASSSPTPAAWARPTPSR
jgi:hypothetical protein